MSKPSAEVGSSGSYVRSSQELPGHSTLRAANVERPEPGVVEGDLVVSGWALAADRPLRWITATVGGRTLARVVPDRDRPDIEAAFTEFPHGRSTGFRIRLPEAVLPDAGLIELAAETEAGTQIPFWALGLGEESAPESATERSRFWRRPRRALPESDPLPEPAPDRTAAPAFSDRPLRVVALISSYNEEDIIGPVVSHLAENGVWSYLVDNGSRDGTVAAARAWLGRGLLGVDVLANPPSGRTAWRTILARKLELSRELGADWYIHHDADEFRESPWPGTTLAGAIETVDRLGYNTIDFRVLNFPPVDDTFRPGDDPRTHFVRWEGPAEYDRMQRKCWKAGRAAVSLEEGGHDVQFAGRRVFPLRFLLRHYPIRSQAHGVRKVLRDRQGRFVAEEVDYGWHRQYDHVSGPDHLFLRNPALLRHFDLDEVRLETMLEDTGGEPSTASDQAADPPESDERGFLERVSDTVISGWAVRGGDPTPTEIILWDGGRLIAHVTADQPRPDLAEQGIGSGLGGFTLRTPRELADGSPHWIWATVAGSGATLGGSPLALHAAGRVAIGRGPQRGDAVEVA